MAECLPKKKYKPLCVKNSIPTSALQNSQFAPLYYLSTISAAYLVAASSTLALFVSKIAPFAVISSKM